MSKFLIAVIPAVGIGVLLRDALPVADNSILIAVSLAALVSAAAGVVYLVLLVVLRDSSARDLLAPLRRRGNKQP